MLPSESVFGMGRGLSDLLKILKFLTSIVFSPTWVMNNSPSIPIKSPKSKSFLKISL